MNIYRIFEQAAKEHPRVPALVHGSEEITYSELEQRVFSFESQLSKKGIQKGDRVFVFLPMSMDLYALILAILRMGAVVVFADQWSDKQRIQKALTVAPCKVIAGSAFSLLVSMLNPALWGLQKVVLNHKKVENSGKVCECDSDDEALVTFTTGSTGIPKAANRTHAFLYAQLNALIPYLSKVPGERVFCTLPVITLLNLSLGKTTILPDFFLKPAKFKADKMFRAMHNHSVTECITSPFYVSALAKGGFPASLRLVQTGGGMVNPEDAFVWKNAGPRIEFESFYGATECEPISHMNADEMQTFLHKRGNFAGEIAKETEVKIISFQPEKYLKMDEKEFQNILCEEGQTGEVLVCGTHVLEKYVGMDESMLNNKLRVGGKLWHRTGDAGYKEKNSLFLMGRAGERIPIESGFIFPAEVEKELKKITGKACGTMVQVENKSILFVLQEMQKSVTEMLRVIADKWSIKPEVITITELPLDPRHNTKIMYDKLRDQTR